MKRNDVNTYTKCMRTRTYPCTEPSVDVNRKWHRVNDVDDDAVVAAYEPMNERTNITTTREENDAKKNEKKNEIY